jgi:hypothetical protein
LINDAAAFVVDLRSPPPAAAIPACAACHTGWHGSAGLLLAAGYLAALLTWIRG